MQLQPKKVNQSDYCSIMGTPPVCFGRTCILLGWQSSQYHDVQDTEYAQALAASLTTWKQLVDPRLEVTNIENTAFIPVLAV